MVSPIFAGATLDFGGLEVFPSGLLVTSVVVHAVRVSVSRIARTVLIFFIFCSSGMGVRADGLGCRGAK
jgi:hypothetical protein